MGTMHAMEGGPTDTPYARAIVDAIVDGRLVTVECPEHPDAACLITWWSNAYEQIDAYVRDQVRAARRVERKAIAAGLRDFHVEDTLPHLDKEQFRAARMALSHRVWTGEMTKETTDG